MLEKIVRFENYNMGFLTVFPSSSTRTQGRKGGSLSWKQRPRLLLAQMYLFREHIQTVSTASHRELNDSPTFCGVVCAVFTSGWTFLASAPPTQEGKHLRLCTTFDFYVSKARKKAARTPWQDGFRCACAFVFSRCTRGYFPAGSACERMGCLPQRLLWGMRGTQELAA